MSGRGRGTPEPARSFVDGDTHFRLEREEQPVGDGGLTAVRPTGVVICEECGQSATNIDEIPHAKDCDQRFVHSRFYAAHMLDGRCGSLLSDEVGAVAGSSAGD
ncbi:hypothetical protein SAMN05216388_1017120 [Halorientalis persicus]|uniref:Uncharacterized protein n=1 Tax=Halorientalis persicus TaxID=1367881 RepID=A0A1H8S247_9EURY|nr:hypothetical protein [Halorientalis persicus]SEO72751.1 hypothetical protein SAMN05216388_1017120 [Halorientalis persicus]